MQRRRTQRLEQPMQLGTQLAPHRHVVVSQPRLVYGAAHRSARLELRTTVAFHVEPWAAQHLSKVV